MKKETVHFDSKGPSGNIYDILGKVAIILRKQQRIIDYNEVRDRVFASQSYEEALTVIREYVKLIDDSGVE